jgi:plasmid stabilization system protein ParE
VSYELVVRSRAKADIRRAAKWYEKQREGLGVDFVSEADNAIRRIEANPEQFQVIHEDIRHAITRRFPYGVFYRIRNDRIVISAVLHLERSDVPWSGKGTSSKEPG